MRVPLSWLDEWVPCLDVPIERLSDLFVERGFPVESVTRLGHAYENIVVGEVLEVAKHPRADRLVLCRVEAGAPEPLSIVCGAPNVVKGMRVPVALPGAVLPGGHTIGTSKIRGELSEGMLCSGRELEISDDHQGILGLAPDAPIGRPLAEALGVASDTVLDLEVHYNRPDVLSVAGVALELAAALGRELRPEARGRLAAPLATGSTFPIHLEDPEGCPRYLGAVVRGVRVGPSPRWLAERLERAGVRPLNNVVDVTNYVLLELGQPLHAFDLARLAGPEIRVRRAHAGERLRTLDGKERILSGEHLVIADRERAVALAGLMGGADSEVTDATRDLLLESAYFQPFRVQVAANGLGLMTEASRRFGRGLDPNLPPAAAARALALLSELAGGTPELPAGEAATARFEPLTLSLDPRRARALLGAEISSEDMKTHLGRLGFAARTAGAGGDAALEVTVPTRRRDIGEAVDLVEEIGRSFGLENLPDVPAGAGASGAEITPEQDFLRRVRETLVGFGFTEVLTPTLADPRRLALTWDLAHDRDDGDPRFAALANPPAPEAGVLRSDLAAGLLTVVAHHLRHGAPGTRVFEVGRTFTPRSDPPAPGEFPEESVQVAFAVAGLADPESWEGEREVDFFDAKGLAESFLARLGVDTPETRAYSASAWKPGEVAELRAPARVGWIGRVEPRRARAWKLDRPVYLFLASLDALARAARRTGPFAAFSRFPAVKRDLAFFVPSHVPHAVVEAKMRAAAGDLLQSACLFDVYRGQGVATDRKSLAYTLLFAHPERTLLESEVEAAQAEIVRMLAAEVGAVLRERPTKG
jgi:phenylalanyl-tRNA synthetase beta chain